jgi:hypothetical protein
MFATERVGSDSWVEAWLRGDVEAVKVSNVGM